MLIKISRKGIQKAYNIAVESYMNFKVEKNRVLFESRVNYDSLSFDSEEKAQEAFERIFETVGLSAPYNKTLDLTVSREQELEDTGLNKEEEVVKTPIVEESNKKETQAGE